MLETDGQVVTALANTADKAESSKGSEFGGTRYLWEESGAGGTGEEGGCWGTAGWEEGVSWSLKQEGMVQSRRSSTSPIKPAPPSNPEIYSQKGEHSALQNHCYRSTGAAPTQCWDPSHNPVDSPLAVGKLRPANRKDLNIYWGRSGGVSQIPLNAPPGTPQ